MSTKNNAAQTLFRFVSLRAPQLSEEKGQERRFVLAPQNLKITDFYKHVLENPSTPKQVSLTEYARTYTDIFSKDQLRDDDYPVLYEFAIWITKNKETYEENELLEKVANARIAFDYNDPDAAIYILKLWNNLIYQVTTQKDFYVKEIIMQILLSIHIIQHIGTEEENKVIVNARIVLPKELMIDDENLPISQTASRFSNTNSYPSEEMKAQQKVASATMMLNDIDRLQKDLSKAKKLFNVEYQTEYKAKEAAHKSIITPILEQYEADVIAAKRAYCATRNPEVEYNSEDPCNQPEETPVPVLPELEFTFRPEIEAASLINSLKIKNLETLLTIHDYEFPAEFDINNLNDEQIEEVQNLLEETTTFQELESQIAKSKEKFQNQISENIISNEKVFKSIGGVLMPTSKTSTFPFTYQICPKNMGRFNSFDLALDVPDNSWDIVGISYVLTYNNNATETGNYFVKSQVGNKIFLNDLFASATVNGVPIFDMSYIIIIDITFSNGKTTQLNIPNPITKLCYSSSFEIEGEEVEENTGEEENNFIPSGFGFKNIGIADYLKVEQSTHAYVPGEVAHIENIMAREYRQKSTRRLRKSENTSTSSSDTEREQLTDTTSATRFEMQTEIAKMMQEGSDKGFFANAGFNGGGFNVSAGANYAHHQSKEESTRQAMTQAQDVTERAMDRIVTKVHEERIEKIIEEFEENNAHGLDNREGDKHVVGVFRWVDKLMKNQILNYGKRMMFEFMVPEPAKLHELGMKVTENASDINLVEPVDPRKSSIYKLDNFSTLESDVILKYWTTKYNVGVDEKLVGNLFAGTSFDFFNQDANRGCSKTGTIKIPDGYVSTEANISFNGMNSIGTWDSKVLISIGNKSIIEMPMRIKDSQTYSISNFIGEIPVTFAVTGYHTANATVNVKCELTREAKNAWFQKTFKSIIDAYEEAMVEYNNKLEAEQNKAVVIKGSNPSFYRQIENTVLRKNCISYMADRALGSTQGYGLSGLTIGNSFTDYETNLTSKLDKYTAFVKFMEQAFEWENLSYYLYPFYWGDKNHWGNLYQQEDVDPLFRAFLQSGMARVVATVRPGFENAVQFYVATGKIWNGGEIPVIGDDLYLSIIDEMKEPKGAKQGKSWITRLPTPLNILQARSIGLEVEHALPFTDEDPTEFEIPGEVVTETDFSIEDVVLQSTPTTIGDVNRLYTQNGNLVLAKNDEVLAQMTISDLVNAERQIDGMRIEEEELQLTFKDKRVASIPLSELKDRMGI